VVGVVAHLDSSGGTADEIAQSLNASMGGVGLQGDLEMLVRRGILDRRGIGRGALYSLARRGRAYAARIASAARRARTTTTTLSSGLAGQRALRAVVGQMAVDSNPRAIEQVVS